MELSGEDTAGDDTAGDLGDASTDAATALYTTIQALRPAAAVNAARRVVLADLVTRDLDPDVRHHTLLACLLADFGRVVLRLPPGEAAGAAADVLGRVPSLRHAATMVRHRHERVDGSGLPAGLTGGEIPFGSQVIALTDLVVTQRRTAPIEWPRRVEVMKDNAGSALDVDLADQTFELLRRSDARAIVDAAGPDHALAVIAHSATAGDAAATRIPLGAMIQRFDDPVDMAGALVEASWPTGAHRAIGVHRIDDGELLTPIAAAGPEVDHWRPIAATSAMHALHDPTVVGARGRFVTIVPIRDDRVWGLAWGVSDDEAGAETPLTEVAEALSIALSRDRQRRRLDALAHGDELTGLANRRRLENELALLFSGPAERRADAALIMCDVDGLKRVNDTRGHAAGDDVLRAVASVLRQLASDVDGVAARLGGDEFCLLLRSGGLLRAEGVARQATRQVRASAPAGAGLSCGIAYAAQARTPAELLGRADERQYLVKRRRLGTAAPKPPTHDRRRRGDR